MPLPPLPVNNTDRAWLKYTSGGIEHEMCWRMPAATPQADVITQANTIATNFKGQLPTADGFISLRHQDAFSTLSFPLAFTAQAGTSATAYEANDKPRFIAWSGRSLGGYRCRFTFFSPYVPDTVAYRVNVGVLPTYDALLTALKALTPTLRAVDGQAVIWNNYHNLGYNSYWQRQERSS